MEKYIPLLRRTGLFDGISDNEIISLLRCLDARVRTYNRGEYVIHEGDVLSLLDAVGDSADLLVFIELVVGGDGGVDAVVFQQF